MISVVVEVYDENPDSCRYVVEKGRSTVIGLWMTGCLPFSTVPRPKRWQLPKGHLQCDCEAVLVSICAQSQ